MAEEKLKLRNNVSAANFSGAVKEYDLPSFKDENGANLVPISPVFLVDPSQDPILAKGVVSITNSTGTLQMGTAFCPTDSSAFQGLGAAACMMVRNSTALLSTVRTPDKFGFGSCTTVAATDVYTPTAGKKFRLIRAIVIPAAGMAAAGLEVINLTEETLGTFLTIQAYLPAAAGVVTQPPIVIDLGPNGYLSTTVSKKFQITLGTACTAGAIGVTFIGTEE